MNCSKCGNILTVDDKFCPGCGSPVPMVSNPQPASPIEELDVPNNAPMNNMMNNNPAPQMNNNMNNNMMMNNMQQPMNNNMMMNNVQQPMNNNMMNNNQNKKKSSIGILYIIVGVIAVIFIIVFIVSKNGSADSGGGNSSSGGNTTPVSTTSTYKVRYGNYDFSVSTDIAYQLQNDQLLLGSETDGWVAAIDIGEKSYDEVKASKSQVVSNLKTKGITAKEAVIKTFNNVEYITIEAVISGTNCIIAYAKLDPTHIIGIIVYNEENSYDYEVLEKIAPIISTATYASGSNSIEVKPNINGVLDFE